MIWPLVGLLFLFAAAYLTLTHLPADFIRLYRNDLPEPMDDAWIIRHLERNTR